MRRSVLPFLVLALPLLGWGAPAVETLQLHPENPHYLQYLGRPLLVIGSGEHYGAVLNADFDFRKYLATLGRDGLNHTRLFTGATYVEPEGAFQITRNTLAPRGERYLAPWARSDQPGYAGGGNKFDLERWDPAYFARLRAFVEVARASNIIVEVTLFCPFYNQDQWRLSPFHPDNNINDAGHGVVSSNVYTLDRSGNLFAYQERFVRRAVAELRDFDNIYYEICNEPYFGGVQDEWQARIAEIIADAQTAHPNPKLISQNITNRFARVEARLAHVDIYNFHYATPPDAVQLNWHLERPIGDNETGFSSTNNAPYRMEAWDLVIAGGALFSHLDYSFAVGFEDGTFAYPHTQPGGGNATLRKQFRILREFIEGLPFTRMHPDNTIITDGVPSGYTARALLEPGRTAAIYLRPQLASPFSVRWTGVLEAPEAGRYTLHASSDDGIRVWLGEELVIDRWEEQDETEQSGEIDLTAGPHALKVEYFHNRGNATVKLYWTRPGKEREPIPASAFRSFSREGNGLQGEYFHGRNFNRPWQIRSDAQIQFAWGLRSPFAVIPEGEPLRLHLDLPRGPWRATWIDPLTGEQLREDRLRHREGMLIVEAPPFTEDIALRLQQR